MKPLKSVIFLSSSIPDRQFEKIKKLLQKNKLTCFGLRYDFYNDERISKLGNAVNFLDTYCPKSDYINIHKTSAEWATRWHTQDKFSSLISENNINLGKVYDYHFHFYLIAVLRIFVMVQNFFRENEIEEVHIVLAKYRHESLELNDKTPLLEIITSFLAKDNGIKVVNHFKTEKNKTLLNFFGNFFFILKTFWFHSQNIFFIKVSNLFLRAPLKRSNCTSKLLFVQSSHSILDIAKECNIAQIGRGIWVYTGRHSKILPIKQYLALDFSGKTNHLWVSQKLRIKLFRIVCRDLNNRNYFNYRKSNLLPVISKYLYYLFTNEFEKTHRQIGTAEKIFKSETPSAVIADNSVMPTERLYFLMAKAKKIPTIEMHHGVVHDQFLINYPKYNISDKNIVLGELDFKKKIKQGGDTCKYVIGGCARFDSYIASNKPKIGNARNTVRIGVTLDKISKYYGYIGIHNSIENQLIKYLHTVLSLNLDNVVFTFRLRHGVKNSGIYRSIISSYPNLKIEDASSFETKNWLQSLSVLITDYSTIGLEAVLLDIPVIILNFGIYKDPIGYEVSKAFCVVENQVEYKENLVSILKFPQRNASHRAQFSRYGLNYKDHGTKSSTAAIINGLIN